MAKKIKKINKKMVGLIWDRVKVGLICNRVKENYL